jgi:hypothetical protein
MRNAPVTAMNIRNVALKIHSTFHLRNRNLELLRWKLLQSIKVIKSTEVVLLSYLSSIFLKMLQIRG